MKAALLCLFLIIGAFVCAEGERIYDIQRNTGLTSYGSENEVQIQSSLDTNEDAYKPQTRGKGKLALSVIRAAITRGWHKLPSWIQDYFSVQTVMKAIDTYYDYSDSLEEVFDNALYDLSCMTIFGCSPNASSHGAKIIMILLPV